MAVNEYSSINEASPLNCLVSYQGHSLGECLTPFAEKQSVYSTAPTDWAIRYKVRPNTISTCNGYRRKKWTRGVMVTVVGNEHGNTSSNPTRD